MPLTVQQSCGNPDCLACSLYGIASVPATAPAVDGVISDPSVLEMETKCVCEACKLKRREPSLIGRGVVHSYSHAPSRWQLKRNKVGDTFPYFMGVELETTRVDTGPYINNENAADMRRPKRHWLVKRDGSVSGPEFVSHPATLPWWQSNVNDLREMFGYLIHAGYRSHNGREAGMHVNISRDAFSNPEHLLRFLNLINKNEEWSRIMSQRTNDQIVQWARINYRGWTIERARRAFTDIYSSHTDKYEAVNIPYGQKRIEFRLPRGTLRVDRFMKNLEWTAAMVGYTRSTALPTTSDFMLWARKHSQVYANLNNFIGERLTELQSAAANA